MHTILCGQTADTAVFRAVDVDLRRIGVGRAEQHLLAHVQHRPQLQAGRGHRDAADQQAVAAFGHALGDQAAVGSPRGRAGDDVDPVLVGGGVDHLGRAVGDVDGQDVHPLLVPRLHGEQRRAACRPVHGGQVLPVTACDVHPRAVQAEQRKGHLGVGRACRGIGDDVRRVLRVGRVADGPARHGAVRGPPVAAGPVHLLGGDELGEAPGDVLSVLLDQRAILAGGQLDHTQPPIGDVRDVRAGGIGPRVDDRLLDQHPHRAGGQVEDVQLAGEGECRDRERVVDAIGHDTAAGLAGALTPCALLGGQLLLAGQEFGGVDELRLAAAREVGRPEAVPRVGAGLRTQEQHARAVRRNAELLGRPESEALSAGLLAEERHVVEVVGHFRTLSDAHGETPTPSSFASSASTS